MKTGIITVSSAYLREEKCKAHDIGIVELLVQYDGKVLKESEISDKDFLKLLDEGKQVSTSQPAPQDFINVYEEFSKRYDNVLVFVLSKEISGTYNSALLARDLFEGDLNIIVINTQTAAIGMENIIDFALENLALDFDVLVEKVEEYCADSHTFLIVDDLSILVKNGRLSILSSLLGKLLLLKVVLFLDKGKVAVFNKQRTRKRAYEILVNEVYQDFVKKKAQTVYITYSINVERVNHLRKLLLKKIPDLNIVVSKSIGPVLLKHIGCDGVGIAW